MNRRAAHPDNSAEMLELIAKVTASISDRMDVQDEAIEEVRSLARAAKAQIFDRMPRAIESMQAEEREQVEAEYHRNRRKWGGLREGAKSYPKRRALVFRSRVALRSARRIDRA